MDPGPRSPCLPPEEPPGCAPGKREHEAKGNGSAWRAVWGSLAPLPGGVVSLGAETRPQATALWRHGLGREG